MLTQRQKDTLDFVHARISESGIAPSFDEITEHLNLKSKSGVHRIMCGLVERGFIRRLPNRARANEVLKLSDGKRNHAEPLQLVVNDMPKLQRDIDARTVSVPVLGRIAAGVPISAITNHTHDIACPPDLLTNGEHFALEVKGDSMLEAGIHDGDTVIVRRSAEAMNGDIVVAIVAKEEATLKRLRIKGSTVALEACNPEFKTRIFCRSQVEIVGRLVGLMRRY